MGWDGSGNVNRTNGVFTGTNVWQQDLAADVDVTASRMDVHDQDLADAMEKCLNREGENAMAADLALGGFELKNIGALGGDLTNFAIGTWTPTITGVTTPGTHTYDYQSGKYLRVGDYVLFYGAVRITTLDTWAGDVRITGLPYANATVVGAFCVGRTVGITYTDMVGGYVEASQSYITLLDDINASVGLAIDATDFALIGGGTLIVFHGFYSVT